MKHCPLSMHSSRLLNTASCVIHPVSIAARSRHVMIFLQRVVQTHQINGYGSMAIVISCSPAFVAAMPDAIGNHT